MEKLPCSQIRRQQYEDGSTVIYKINAIHIRTPNYVILEKLPYVSTPRLLNTHLLHFLICNMGISGPT